VRLPVVVVAIEVSAGVYRYFSDAGYITSSTDTPASTAFEPLLTGKITWSRSASVYIWGRSRSNSGIGAIDLVNAVGALDALLIDGTLKGRRIEIYTGRTDQAFALFVLEASAIVDEVSAVGERALRITSLGLLSKLNVPTQPLAYQTGAVDDSAVGRLRPISIGQPLSVPAVLVDSVDFDYDVHDSTAYESIVLVRDGGFPLVEGVGWQVAVGTGRYGFERLALPTSRVVADVLGQTVTVEVVIPPAFGDFDAGLSGWSQSGTGISVIGGVVTFAGGFGQTAQIDWPHPLVAGATYAWSIASFTRVSGTLQVVAGGAVVAESATTGPISGTFVPGQQFDFLLRSKTGGYNFSFDGVRLDRVAESRYLPEVLRHLLIDRGGLLEIDIDWSSVTALDAVAHWPISYWADSNVTLRDVVDDVLDSFAAAIFEDHSGKIAVRRVELPSAGTPVAEITESMLLLGSELQVEIDKAPGLSKTIAGARNWYRYNDSELLDGVSSADRAKLTADYRVRATSGAIVNEEIRPTAGQGQRPRLSPIGAYDPPVPGSSRPASESGFGTLLDNQADCLAHADHVASIYPDGGVSRFATWKIVAQSSALRSLDPLQVVTQRHSRFGLAAGVPALVTEISGAYGDNQVTLDLFYVVPPPPPEGPK